MVYIQHLNVINKKNKFLRPQIKTKIKIVKNKILIIKKKIQINIKKFLIIIILILLL